jgi:hypothetical protein
MLIVIAAAGVLLAQAAAPAQTAPASAPGPTPAAATAPPEKPKKPKLICTNETQISSFIPKRVCRTPEQIEAERAAADRITRRVADHGNVCQGEAC